MDPVPVWLQTHCDFDLTLDLVQCLQHVFSFGLKRKIQQKAFLQYAFSIHNVHNLAITVYIILAFTIHI